MNESCSNVPGPVETIGWFWIAVGVFLRWPGLEIPLSVLLVGPALYGAAETLWAVLLLAAGVVAVIAGARFLKLRRWALSVLGAFSWLAIVGVLGFATYLMWFTYWRRPVAERSPGTLSLAIGAATLISLLLGVPFVLSLAHIRSQAVQEAFRRSEGNRPEVENS